MKTQRNRGGLVLALALAFVGACGSSTGTTASEAGTGTGATSSDITTYQQLASDARSAASAYDTAMTGSNLTLASCHSIHDGYDAQVRPWVSLMVQMAGPMDDYMNAHGGEGNADLRCGSATLLDELDYHRSIACTFPTVAADREEAARHVAAMNSYAGHLWNRCGEMLGSTTGGACCNWAPRMNGCELWSSTCCSGMMRHGCCGGMMGGGGMMHGGDCCGAGW